MKKIYTKKPWNGAVSVRLQMQIRKAAQWVQKALTSACDYSMPRVAPIRKDSVYWWSCKIADLRKI